MYAKLTLIGAKELFGLQNNSYQGISLEASPTTPHQSKQVKFLIPAEDRERTCISDDLPQEYEPILLFGTTELGLTMQQQQQMFADQKM